MEVGEKQPPVTTENTIQVKHNVPTPIVNTENETATVTEITRGNVESVK